jgi:hypothetical protein
MTSLAALAEAEVRARHDFFVDWFTGRADQAAFDTCARAFAPDMRRIGPEGAVQDRAAILAMLRAARAARPGDFAITIEMGIAQDLAPGTVLVTYDEGQVIGPRHTLRRSTAVFTADPAAPEGVVWRHLHETWIENEPAATPAANTEDQA